MSAYTSHLRVYSWLILVAFLVAIALANSDASPYAELDGWETLPDTCTAALACTANNP